jgi:hypothetical protein
MKNEEICMCIELVPGIKIRHLCPIHSADPPDNPGYVVEKKYRIDHGLTKEEMEDMT